MGYRLAGFADRALPDGRATLREAFSTNALFMRGPVDRIRGEQLEELWEVCRPWHERWLDRIRPRAILCIGNRRRGPGYGQRSPYDWFRRLLSRAEEQPPHGLYQGSQVKASIGELQGRKTLVLGLPHLSRWDSHHERASAGVAYARELLQTAVEG